MTSTCCLNCRTYFEHALGSCPDCGHKLPDDGEIVRIGFNLGVGRGVMDDASFALQWHADMGEYSPYPGELEADSKKAVQKGTNALLARKTR